MPGSLIDLFDQYIDNVSCVDVGAMIDDGVSAKGHDNAINVFFQHPKVKVVGFEPQKDECEVLCQRYPGHTFLPYALGDGNTHTFYTTYARQSSSFYPVDHSIVDPLSFPPETFDVVSSGDIETVRLDDIPEVGECDFLKLDAEGAEVMILENAPVTLSKCSVVQVEGSILPYRLGAPVLRDVDRVLGDAGFLMVNMGLMGANYYPWSVTGAKQNFISQGFLVDAHYARDFRTFIDMPTAKLFKTAAVLHDVYKAFDLCAFILRTIDNREGLDTEEQYGGWFNT